MAAATPCPHSQGAATVTVSDDDDPAGYVPDPQVVADVRSYAAETEKGEEHVNRWKRVLIGLGVEDYPGLTAMTAAEAQEFADKGWTRWDPVAEELEKAEAAAQEGLPVVGVTAGSGITEGGSAVFTLTASPALDSDLAVDVTISQSGDYGVVTGTRSVTVGTSGTATLSVATTGDNTDEPDGSVTATIGSGSGYTVSTSQGAATVTVSDDDDPPVVSITAGPAITEGGNAGLHHHRQSRPGVGPGGGRDGGPAGGLRRAPRLPRRHRRDLRHGHPDHRHHRGRRRRARRGGHRRHQRRRRLHRVRHPGFGPGQSVSDDDDPPATPESLPVLDIADGSAREGGVLLDLVITLSQASEDTVYVLVKSRDVTAAGGDDYNGINTEISFKPGQTEKTVTVIVLQDDAVEGDETLEVVLSEPEGATIGDGVAVGTIIDDD